MDEVLIVGLPRALLARFIARAKRAGLIVTTVLADVGKEGTPRLLPDPSGAIHTVRAYSERVAPAAIVALTYAPLPENVVGELCAISALNMGSVDVIEQGRVGWPLWNRRRGFDQEFIDCVFLKLEDLLCGGQVAVIPSQYIRNLASQNNRFLIADNSLDVCDGVALHRHKFLRDSANALNDLCGAQGGVGRLEDFFQQRALDYAHSGGSTVTVEVFQNGKRVYKQQTNDHLKRGDATTPQSAARVYFHAFHLADTSYYVAILYAGPHPRGDFTRRIDI